MVGNSFAVTIPKNFIKEAGFKSGDEVVVEGNKDLRLMIVKPAGSAVKTTITPGTVKLVAKSAARRASYNWQQSANNGVTWIDLPTTLRASLLVSGLTSKAAYQFRFRSITKEGISGWFASVGIVIQ